MGVRVGEGRRRGVRTAGGVGSLVAIVNININNLTITPPILGEVFLLTEDSGTNPKILCTVWANLSVIIVLVMSLLIIANATPT